MHPFLTHYVPNGRGQKAREGGRLTDVDLGTQRTVTTPAGADLYYCPHTFDRTQPHEGSRGLCLQFTEEVVSTGVHRGLHLRGRDGREWSRDTWLQLPGSEIVRAAWIPHVPSSEEEDLDCTDGCKVLAEPRPGGRELVGGRRDWWAGEGSEGRWGPALACLVS